MNMKLATLADVGGIVKFTGILGAGANNVVLTSNNVAYGDAEIQNAHDQELGWAILSIRDDTGKYGGTFVSGPCMGKFFLLSGVSKVSDEITNIEVLRTNIHVMPNTTEVRIFGITELFTMKMNCILQVYYKNYV